MNRCSPLVRLLLLGVVAIANTPFLNAAPSHDLAVGVHTIRANDDMLQTCR